MPSSFRDPLDEQLRQACAELEQRLSAGEGCRAEDLLLAHPGLAERADSALELIYTEFVPRERLGQPPSPEEWYGRSPQWREDLRQLFEVHQAVGGAPTRSYDGPPLPDHEPGVGTLYRAGARLGNY